eukprot:Nitzschia sp. Nitz4//scaffold22_size323478//122602//125117//NITZ4_000524-RA/size323478-processed-gene-0.457-mRNA-1//-1//CDS//3329542986//1349//frame0
MLEQIQATSTSSKISSSNLSCISRNRQRIDWTPLVQRLQGTLEPGHYLTPQWFLQHAKVACLQPRVILKDYPDWALNFEGDATPSMIRRWQQHVSELVHAFIHFCLDDELSDSLAFPMVTPPLLEERLAQTGTAATKDATADESVAARKRKRVSVQPDRFGDYVADPPPSSFQDAEPLVLKAPPPTRTTRARPGAATATSKPRAVASQPPTAKRRRQQPSLQPRAPVARESIRSPSLRRSPRTQHLQWVEQEEEEEAPRLRGRKRNVAESLPHANSRKAKPGRHIQFAEPEEDDSDLEQESLTEEIPAALPMRKPSGMQEESDSEPWRRWVKLVHLGHVSDYHGLQREHDSTFLPLVYHKSLDVLHQTIDSTLTKAGFGGDESDEEIEEENKRYDKVVSNYKKHFSSDNVKRAHSKPVMNVDDLPPVDVNRKVVFGRDLDKEPSAAFPSPKDEQGDLLTPSFRELEESPLDIGTDSAGGSSKKRVSRRNMELIVQRKASMYALSKLRHSLGFIAQYNKGLEDTSEVQEQEQNLEDEERLEEKFDSSDIPEVDPATKHAKARDQKKEAKPPYVYTVPETVDPTSFQLPHQGLVDEYLHLYRKRQFGNAIQPLANDSLEGLRAALDSTLSNFPNVFESEDFFQERRAWIRIVRGYNNKADQERIEKTEHEEKRTLKLREFAYQHPVNRNIKQAWKEVERFEFQPIDFSATSRVSRTTSGNTCALGAECLICTAKPGANPHSTADDTILRPAFRVIPDEEAEDSLGQEDGPRLSRTKERALLREKIGDELHVIAKQVAFVEKYNAGWMETKKQK